MDSLTQITLGAAVGIVFGGKKYGRKSALIGAVCGTIPDLDVFFFVNTDPVTAFTYHRGFSHSFLFTFFATPITAFLFSRIKWFGAGFKDRQLHSIIFLAFLTHILLDGLTIYGTQLFWPLQSSPVGAGSIFIIDPLYTVPLLFGVIVFLIGTHKKFINMLLCVSTVYLLWGYAAQQWVYGLVPTEERGQRILVQTTPFNTFLWRVLIMTDSGYKVGYYSIFDKNKEINFNEFDSQASLIKPIESSFAVNRLQWFTKGFYKVSQIDDKVIVTDLRMGLEPENYVFGFIVGENTGNVTKEIPNERYSKPREMRQLSNVWNRIWHEDIVSK